jgi:hypothetical protein
MNIQVGVDQSSQQLVESIYAIQDWGYAIIFIAGRVYLIDGDIEMADEFQSISEHFFYGKDITNYILQNATHLSINQNKDAFTEYLNTKVKRRKFRFHKNERYVRYSV